MDDILFHLTIITEIIENIVIICLISYSVPEEVKFN